MNIKPALCAEMDFDAGCYWQQDGWIVEEKFDGIRAIVHVGPETVATGRRFDAAGVFLPLRDQRVAAGWDSHLHGCVFDGEAMADGSYWAWDLVQLRGRDLRQCPLRERKGALQGLGEWMPEHTRLVPWFANVRQLGDFGEGIVWKKLSSRYGGNWFKCKRTITIDAKVVGIEDHGVAVLEGRGKIRGVPDGILPGTLVEVVAFDEWPSGCLKSGKFLRVRDDK